jgi:hypothetical protein
LQTANSIEFSNLNIGAVYPFETSVKFYRIAWRQFPSVRIFDTIHLMRTVRSEVFTAVAMKNVFFWDIEPPVHASQETQYFATECSRLVLSKI